MVSADFAACDLRPNSVSDAVPRGTQHATRPVAGPKGAHANPVRGLPDRRAGVRTMVQSIHRRPQEAVTVQEGKSPAIPCVTWTWNGLQRRANGARKCLVRAPEPGRSRSRPQMAPPADERPDDLARAVLGGSAQALDRWYRAEHPRVWRLCLGMLADRAEADDLTQDALLHMLDKLSQWDRSRPWAAWRNSLVLNLCRDRLRRGAARARAEERAAAARERDDLPARLPDPLRAASSSELAEIVSAALSRLTLREREAFVLVELEGATTADAAAALEVGESTVRSLVTLARRRLRALLGPRLAADAAGTGAQGGSHA